MRGKKTAGIVLLVVGIVVLLPILTIIAEVSPYGTREKIWLRTD
jgi:hypothetical protein